MMGWKGVLSALDTVLIKLIKLIKLMADALHFGGSPCGKRGGAGRGEGGWVLAE